MDPSNVDAWIVKIKAAGNDIKGDRSSEISTYIDTALDHGANNQGTVKIYLAVFEVAERHIDEAIRMLNDNQDRIKMQLRDRRVKSDIAAMDSGYVAGTTQILNEAIEYRNIIPDAIVGREDVLKNKAREMAEMCNKYYEALQQRYRLYDGSFSLKTKERQSENLRRIMSGTGEQGNSFSFLSGNKGGSIFGKLFG